jgi:2-dehydro-3-deoxygluconokinase
MEEEKLWFYFTGITPAISDTAAELTLDAVKKAKQNKVKVRCDLNYRGEALELRKSQ